MTYPCAYFFTLILLKNKEIEIAVNLIRTGMMSYSVIAECTGLAVEEVEKLAETLNHSA